MELFTPARAWPAALRRCLRAAAWAGMALLAAAQMPLALVAAPKPAVRPPAQAPGNPLAAVEAEQAGGGGMDRGNESGGRINLASISYHYAHPSSYADGGHAAPNAIDGSDRTAWVIARSVTQAWIEVSLGLSVPCNQLALKEPGKQIVAHEVEHYDGQAWRTLHRGGAINPAGFRFPTVTGGMFRVTIRTQGGGGLTEIEAYNPGGEPVRAAPARTVVITPTDEPAGRSMKYAGLSGVHLVPGNNQPAWLRYLGINGVRTWYTAATHVRAEDLFPGNPAPDLQEFDRRKAALRANPERDTSVDWAAIKARNATLYQHNQASYAVDYAHDIFKKLTLTTVCELNMGKWDATWQNSWKNWLTLYAWAYCLARDHEVSRFTYANEPETFINRITLDVFVRSLQIHADALRCAVEDVNRFHGKNLTPVFSAPVLAGSGTSDMAKSMMRNLRTDYHGRPAGHDLVQWFDKHRYNARPRSFVAEIDAMNEMMRAESPRRQALPIVYTEFNYSTGASWAKPETPYSNDTPGVFRNLASVWGLAMEQGVHGMYLFRFADERLKGNNVCSTLVREHDPDVPAGSERDIGDSTKNAEVMRLFAEGFQNERRLCKTSVRCPDLNYRAHAADAPEAGLYYLWMVQPNSSEDYPVSLDLSRLGVSPGGRVMIKEISDSHFGEVVQNLAIPQTRTLAMVQPRDSVWLASITRNPPQVERLLPSDDAEVIQGPAARNCGNQPVMSVQQGAAQGANHISFLKFDLGGRNPQNLTRALLQVHGRVSGGQGEPFTILAYGVEDDRWSESGITAMNAPAVYRTVSAVKTIGLNSRPVAHMTFSATQGTCAVDVTDYVREHPDGHVTFVLIKEKKTPADDFGKYTATLDTKECPDASRRPCLELWSTPSTASTRPK